MVPILEANLVSARRNGGGSRKVVTALSVFVAHHVSSGVLGPKVQGNRHPFSPLFVCRRLCSPEASIYLYLLLCSVNR